MPRWVIAAWLTAGSLALGGCSFDFNGAADYPVNQCAFDTDCVAGACAAGLCVEPSPEALRVVLAVSPREDAEPLPVWQMAPRVVVGPESEVALSLPRGVRVVGRVRAGEEIVPADIVFTRRHELPTALDDTVSTRTSAEASQIDVDGARIEVDYGVTLGAGGTYDVRVIPTSASFDTLGEAPIESTADRVLPPLWRRSVTIPSDADLFEVTFDYPALDRPCGVEVTSGCTLTGMIQSGDGTAPNPESGLVVRAFDTESNVAVSTVGVTVSGAFSIVISPDIDPEASASYLRISGGSERSLFPELTATLESYDEGYVSLAVPDLPTVTYSGTVETSEGVPVAGALVQFVADELVDTTSGLVGRLVRRAVCGEAGEFSLALLPGEYEVIITPDGSPTEDALDEPGIVVSHVTLSDLVTEVQGQLFVAPRRGRFGAQVLTPSGLPLPLQIDATPNHDVLVYGSVGTYSRSSSATSGPTGWFDLRLDVGRYDAIGQTPEGSGYPWVVLAGVEVPFPGASHSARLDASLPVPYEGVLQTSEGNPVEGARIDAYVVLYDVTGERTVQVASATTGAEGAYRLLLPSRIERP